MNLENLLSVSGMPGLYKLVTTRSNGLIIEDLDDGKRTFISMRKHQFTPLESVGIYTYTDAAEIGDIFRKIRQHETPPPDSLSDAGVVHDYFRQVVPDYDESRVYLSDIKKVLKWYAYLNERGLLEVGSDEEE